VLIGLHGPALSGKDTVYGILRTLSFEGPLTPYLVRRDAFADRLKISAARALGYKGPDEAAVAYMNLFKKHGEIRAALTEDGDPDGEIIKGRWISGREYLQFYGTEAHRDVFGQSFWIKAVLPDGYPSDSERDKTLLVVTDVRFPNEAKRIHECGGQVWKIDRSHEGITESGHASEQPLPNNLVHRTILNDGSLEELREQVSKVVKWFLVSHAGGTPA
jgi:hypothetical protein